MGRSTEPRRRRCSRPRADRRARSTCSISLKSGPKGGGNPNLPPDPAGIVRPAHMAAGSLVASNVDRDDAPMDVPGFLARVGADPDDDEDLRQKKSLLVLLAVLILPVSVVWGSLYLAFGSAVGIVPFV